MSNGEANTPTGAGSQITVRQEVGENAGRVVGVQTGAIHGDVYGGDIYDVQVYVLSDAGRDASWKRFLQADTPPYKFLAPYTLQDRLLFKGRQQESEQLVRRIGQQQVSVLYGAAGVGKTSLLAAGVTPNLVSYGALVLQIQDYRQPLQAIRQALLANDQIDLDLPQEASLPELVQAVQASTQGSLVLICDQFEGFFEPPVDEAQRAAFIEALARSLQAVPADYLRLVLALQEDALGRLAALQTQLPALGRQPFMPLAPLDREQARQAIEEPLQVLDYPVSFVGDLVAQRLVPDLADLTPDTPAAVQPLQLQIVCTWLYEQARERRPPHIDLALYRKAKGAEGILARHLEETLATRLADQQELAEQVLAAMAAPPAAAWVQPQQLSLNGTPPQRVQAVLERLTAAKLLVRRGENSHAAYAFTSSSVAQEMRRLAAPQTDRRRQAEAELARIWDAWLARDALATRGQLRYLAAAADRLSPRPLQTLLLLQSAVARLEPTAPWLALLRSQGGEGLVQQLETPGDVDPDSHSGRDSLEKAALLLGIDPAQLPGDADESAGDGAADGQRRPYGAVASAAVVHRDGVVRQTAALALATLGLFTALDRLTWALRSEKHGWRRRIRQMELWAALTDGDPEFATIGSELPPLQRLGAWLWQVWRRLLRDRRRLAGLTLGGAIGAGLGLGLLRAIIVLLAPHRFLVGAQFAVNFFFAALLGAALTFGLLLADHLLGRSAAPDEGASVWRLPFSPERLPVLLATLLGALLFGLAHVVVAWFNGMRLANALLLAPAAFLAGLGVSLAVHDQPRAGWPGILGWLQRAGTGLFFFVLAQGVLYLVGPNRFLAVVWNGHLYESEFYDYNSQWWQRLHDQIPRWSDALALPDAALVGLVLAIGLTVGLLVAARWLARWRSLVERTGD